MQRVYGVQDDFLKDLNDQKAWFLGLMCADGSVTDRRISIYQSGDHGKKLIEYIKELLSFEGNIYKMKTTHLDSWGIDFLSEEMLLDLNSYGIVKRKSYNQTFPNIPDHLIKPFIVGEIDGDGCIGTYSSAKGSSYLHISFVGCKAFIEDAASKVPIVNSGIYQHSQCDSAWEVRWNGRKANSMFDWLYKDVPTVYKSRKYYIAKSFVKSRVYAGDKYIEIRRKVQEQLTEGVPIAKIAKSCEVSFQTIYKWISDGSLSRSNGIKCSEVFEIR